MIDTDKYEGHTEGPWFDGEPTEISNTISNAFFQLYPNKLGKANARLAIDAPLLLAEVKRLRDLHILACDYLQSISNGTLPDSEWPHIHAMIRGDD